MPRLLPQLPFDGQQSIVLRNVLRPAGRPRLDLLRACPSTDGPLALPGLAPMQFPDAGIERQQRVIETLRMAFVPSFAFVSVPSNLRIRSATSFCACGDFPSSFGAMLLFTFATAFRTPLAP